jgi:hypothetical protein
MRNVRRGLEMSVSLYGWICRIMIESKRRKETRRRRLLSAGNPSKVLYGTLLGRLGIRLIAPARLTIEETKKGAT